MQRRRPQGPRPWNGSPRVARRGGSRKSEKTHFGRRSRAPRPDGRSRTPTGFAGRHGAARTGPPARQAAPCGVLPFFHRRAPAESPYVEGRDPMSSAYGYTLPATAVCPGCGTMVVLPAEPLVSGLAACDLRHLRHRGSRLPPRVLHPVGEPAGGPGTRTGARSGPARASPLLARRPVQVARRADRRPRRRSGRVGEEPVPG